MIEFYKYLYAGGFPLRTPYDYQKNPKNRKASQMCQANFKPAIIHKEIKKQGTFLKFWATN